MQAVKSISAGRSQPFPLELVIVDDASTDGCCDNLSAAMSRSANCRVTVKRLNRWSGIPHARNRGVESCTHPICLITDGNTKFPDGWDLPIWRNFHRSRLLAGTIADMQSAFRGYGCTLLLPSMGVSWIPIPHPFGGYVPVAASSCTVIDRALFHHLGGYDETLPLYGAAEPEFSVRAWLSGYEIVNIPDLLIHHWFKPKTEYESFRTSIENILFRNYLRFACYYLPPDLLQLSYEHYARLLTSDFEACLNDLIGEGVWVRRNQLHRDLPRSFSWLVEKFSLTHSDAVVAQ